MQRAHALKFKGKYDDNGKPDRYFSFAPARDLDANDIARLTDAEYRDITGGDKPLYAEVKPAAPKPTPKRAEAPAKKPQDDKQQPAEEPAAAAKDAAGSKE